jgi:hypothetical protein
MQFALKLYWERYPYGFLNRGERKMISRPDLSVGVVMRLEVHSHGRSGDGYG